MPNRTCLMCFGKIPRTAVLTRSYEIVCPQCGRALELSRTSRLLGSLFGLIAAWFAFHFTKGIHSSLGFVIPLAASVLAFGTASPLFLMLSSDLVERPEAPAGSHPSESSHARAPAAHP